MGIIKPRFGKVSRAVGVENGIFVLEDVFEPDPKVSNLYKVDYLSGKIIWECPVVMEPFTELWIDNNGILKVQTWSGEADLNPVTGELTNWVKN